ncbi:MAG TPA: DUF4290 domain-containing protein [Bacteroidia bacterium]|jgi:hypothetical protein|nr:DUF4290 domain-containing protein [Bacteroidia bacterium]
MSKHTPKEHTPPAERHAMTYNTELPQVMIPEYGRNIQKLIEYACAIKDKEERNKIANGIISIMGRLNPMLRDLTDFRHKLWDHLFIISNFKLDVDSPYAKPSKESLTTKPEKVKYPSGKIRFKHYGKGIERLIEKASEMKAGEEKTAFTEAIANLMKKSYLVWNRNTVDDNVIFQELELLSGGKLKVSDNFRLANTYDILARTRNMNPPRTDETRGRERDRGRDRDRGRHNGHRNNNRHRRGR